MKILRWTTVLMAAAVVTTTSLANDGNNRRPAGGDLVLGPGSCRWSCGSAGSIRLKKSCVDGNTQFNWVNDIQVTKICPNAGDIDLTNSDLDLEALNEKIENAPWWSVLGAAGGDLSGARIVISAAVEVRGLLGSGMNDWFFSMGGQITQDGKYVIPSMDITDDFVQLEGGNGFLMPHTQEGDFGPFATMNGSGGRSFDLVVVGYLMKIVVPRPEGEPIDIQCVSNIPRTSEGEGCGRQRPNPASFRSGDTPGRNGRPSSRDNVGDTPSRGQGNDRGDVRNDAGDAGAADDQGVDAGNRPNALPGRGDMGNNRDHNVPEPPDGNEIDEFCGGKWTCQNGMELVTIEKVCNEKEGETQFHLAMKTPLILNKRCPGLAGETQESPWYSVLGTKAAFGDNGSNIPTLQPNTEVRITAVIQLMGVTIGDTPYDEWLDPTRGRHSRLGTSDGMSNVTTEEIDLTAEFVTINRNRNSLTINQHSGGIFGKVLETRTFNLSGNVGMRFEDAVVLKSSIRIFSEADNIDADCLLEDRIESKGDACPEGTQPNPEAEEPFSGAGNPTPAPDPIGAFLADRGNLLRVNDQARGGNEQDAARDNRFDRDVADNGQNIVAKGFFGEQSVIPRLLQNPHPMSAPMTVLNVPSGMVNAYIMDVSGQMVYQNILQAEGGRLEIPLQSNFVSGNLYFLQLAQEGKVLSRMKVMVK